MAIIKSNLKCMAWSQRTTVRIWSLVILLLIVVPLTSAENRAVARLSNAIREAGFQIANSNDTGVALQIETRKWGTIVVIAYASTDKVGTLESRAVTAYFELDKMEPSMGMYLLNENNKYAVGAFSVARHEERGKYVIFFTAHLDAGADGEELRTVVAVVAETAAKVRRILGGQ